MRGNAFVGIDTSNYTTSFAIVSDSGELIANIKRPLPVAMGECGLRQSDAVFHHIKNIPSIMDEARPILKEYKIVAIGVSSRPRNQDGSYMPCFLSGVSVAEGISASLGIPLYRFSHQCGHIMAAMFSAGIEKGSLGEFCALHLSGGTTELVRVSDSELGFRAEIVGGTKDLNAGQLIDRIGVHMGLSFPSGRELEQLAISYSGRIAKRKPSTEGSFVNLSGVENIAKKMLDNGESREAVSAFVINHIADSVIAISEAYVASCGEVPFVFAGGVMSNTIIKAKIKEKIKNAYFAEPSLSSDNAVGIAALTRNAYK